LPSLSSNEISTHLAKIKKYRELEIEKKKLINQYQEARRKLNLIGYREIQKENQNLENIRKGKQINKRKCFEKKANRRKIKSGKRN
jgi:hypothetical protein